MKNVNRYGWGFLLAIGVYWPFALLDQNNAATLSALNAIAASAAFAIVVSFSPGVWATFTTPPREIEKGHALIVGLWCLAVAGLFRFSWLWYLRLTHQLDSIPQLTNDWFGWGVWWFAIGAMCLLIAERYGPRGMPPRAWLVIGALVFGAVCTTLLALTYWSHLLEDLR